MERIATDVEALRLGIADLDAFLIDPCVEGTLDFDPGRGRRDQLDDGCMIRERLVAPILGVATEQAIADRVPLRCARWTVPDLGREAGRPRASAVPLSTAARMRRLSRRNPP
jgi:hypothetical protein